MLAGSIGTLIVPVAARPIHPQAHTTTFERGPSAYLLPPRSHLHVLTPLTTPFTDSVVDITPFGVGLRTPVSCQSL